MAAGDIQYKTAPGQPGFEVEVPQGQPTINNPLGAREPGHIVITQVYMQRRSAYRRPNPNTLCPPEISGGALAYFCEDSERVPLGVADLVTWTRTWASVPLRHGEYSSISVIYPAYAGDNIGVGGQQSQRTEFAAKTRARIDYEYFLVGASTPYIDENSIPLNSANSVTYANFSPNPPPRDLLAGEVVLYNNGTGGGGGGTSPTAITYAGWRSTDAGTASSYSLIAEPSELQNYLGNIWRRATVRVKAR
jgi:hypothetical protein